MEPGYASVLRDTDRGMHQARSQSMTPMVRTDIQLKKFATVRDEHRQGSAADRPFPDLGYDEDGIGVTAKAGDADVGSKRLLVDLALKWGEGGVVEFELDYR